MTEAIYLEVSEKTEAAKKAGRRVSVSGMLKFLGVSRSGYLAWLHHVPSDTEKRREAVKAKIQDAALTSLVTKNSKERVQMGSFRFMFSFGTNLVIQAVTFGAVEMLGGGATAWRTIAFIYCIIGIITNTLAVFSVRELSDEELKDYSG